MASNYEAWIDYYNTMDASTVLLSILLMFILLLFVIFIFIEVIARRDFTIMRKTLWSLSFMTMPGFSQMIYLFLGERFNIDAYGEPTFAEE